LETPLQNLILASASKSRSQMLLNAGVKFSIQVSNMDETPIKKRFSLKPVEEIALKLAVLKAQKISKLNTGALVIGADQALESGGTLYDKPLNHAVAVSQLKALRGKTHRLISAVCVVQNNKTLWDLTDSVNLTMRDLSDEFIQSYLTQAGTDIFSTVGGYRLEDLGAQLFTRVEGDFFTVLGLPLLPLLEFLRSKQILNI
jgi:septum formation protein